MMKGSRLKMSSGSSYWYLSTTDTTSFLGRETKRVGQSKKRGRELQEGCRKLGLQGLDCKGKFLWGKKISIK